ncbi:MAG: hypothetical protein QF681_10950 [Vicinamibacterales bacterium]|nr:hypothetical protein [Vicinamibacterales bacterium]
MSGESLLDAYTGDGDIGALLDERASFLPEAGGRNSNGAWGLLLKTVAARVSLGQREAANMYEHLGMPRHLEMVKEHLKGL